MPRPRIKVSTIPKFPAQVIAGDGIAIEQSGGVFTFRVDADVTPSFESALPFTVGDIFCAGSATEVFSLAAAATGNALVSGGAGAAPAWGKIGLATHVSGTLPAASGGTGVANASTITLGGNVTTGGSFTTSGASALTLVTTGTTSLTLPTTGTLATLAGTEALINKTFNGNAWTAGTGALTIGAGKTLTASNTLTFTGTDSSSVAFGAGGTVLYNGGALGTPSSGALTNCAGLPISTGVSGLGTGVAAFLATPSSANLAAAVTNETGTAGSLVFSASPTLSGTITADAANFSGTITFGTGTLTGLTADATPDSTADYLLTYDASAAAFKKSLISAVVGAAAAGVTSLNGKTGALDIPSICGLRLSLVTGTPVMATDTAGATRVYATPDNWAGKYVPLWDGSDLVPTFFGEVFQDTTDTTKSPEAVVANANYDIYGWDDGGTKRATRSDYWKKSSTITMTIAAPCVVTWANHGLAPGTPVKFTSTGTLPSLSGNVFTNTQYVADSPTTNTFTIVSAATNTTVGASQATTGSQSGTHTATAGDDRGAVARGSGGNCELDLATAGIYLNKNAITNGPAALRGTFLGSIRSNNSATIDWKLGSAASGGGEARLMVSSAYNQRPVEARVTDSAVNGSYTSSTPRAANASITNRVSGISCLQQTGIKATYFSRVTTAAVTSAFGCIGLALNWVTGGAADKRSIQITFSNLIQSSGRSVHNSYSPQLGAWHVQALEIGDNTNATGFVYNTDEQGLLVSAMF